MATTIQRLASPGMTNLFATNKTFFIGLQCFTTIAGTIGCLNLLFLPRYHTLSSDFRFQLLNERFDGYKEFLLRQYNSRIKKIKSADVDELMFLSFILNSRKNLLILYEEEKVVIAALLIQGVPNK